MFLIVQSDLVLSLLSPFVWDEGILIDGAAKHIVRKVIVTLRLMDIT